MSRSPFFVLSFLTIHHTASGAGHGLVWPESRSINLNDNVVLAKPTVPPSYILPSLPALNFTAKINDLNNVDSVAMAGNMALILGSKSFSVDFNSYVKLKYF